MLGIVVGDGLLFLRPTGLSVCIRAREEFDCVVIDLPAATEVLPVECVHNFYLWLPISLYGRHLPL